jgi:quinol monooxygenase YgiN
MTLPDQAPCTVLELRQYTLHPGQRDTLIELFEREFIEPQEALGITLFGQFRDLDDPDRFVWLRGFADMPARAAALAAFYDGPVWQAHRNAANATMIDSDNVLLLRPTGAGEGFNAGPRGGARDDHVAPVLATLYHFDAPVTDAFVHLFNDSIASFAGAAGAELLGSFMTERAPNNFPRLPVRESEHVFAWFARGGDALEAMPEWRAVSAELQRRVRRTETLHLAPTRRARVLHARAKA